MTRASVRTLNFNYNFYTVQVPDDLWAASDLTLVLVGTSSWDPGL